MFLARLSKVIACFHLQSEVNFLGRISHPNLVKLLGYCMDDNELLLVYEFMAKGSLENHLFRSECFSRRSIPNDSTIHKQFSLCHSLPHSLCQLRLQ